MKMRRPSIHHPLLLIGCVMALVIWHYVKDARSIDDKPLHVQKHPQNKIVVNLGMPRTGTNSWIRVMHTLFPDKGGEFHHILGGYSLEDLSELLLLGNRSSVDNVLYQKLANQPRGKVRAMADHPSFLLAPIAKDFPNVYWVQVTRDIKNHVESTLYMLQRYCQNRCACPKAPKCSGGAMALMDRLYYNKLNLIGYMCAAHGNASAIPRNLIHQMLQEHEAQTQRYLEGHPRYLRYQLEDGIEHNLPKVARFLGFNESMITYILENLNGSDYHANKRTGGGGSNVIL